MAATTSTTATNDNLLFSSLISDIKTYNGSDPLLPWLRGIRKMTDSLPAQLLQQKLPRFLQKCTQTFQTDARYRNDLRYVRVWIKLRHGERNSVNLIANDTESILAKGKPVKSLLKNNLPSTQPKSRQVEDKIAISQSSGREQYEHAGENTVVVRFAKTAIGGKSNAEDARHHGLVEPTINTKEAMDAINSMFRDPLGTEPFQKHRSHKTKPNAGHCSTDGFKVFDDNDPGSRVESHKAKSNVGHCSTDGFKVFNDNDSGSSVEPLNTNPPVNEPFHIYCDDDDEENNNNEDAKGKIDHKMASNMPKGAFVFPCPKDIPIESDRAPQSRFREDTVVYRFVGSTISDEPKVENACHHGLVEPTVNLKEAMDDINSMFGKPIEFVRKKRPRKQEKPFEEKSSFLILPDDETDHHQQKTSKTLKPTSSSRNENELFEQTVCTKKAMDDINKIFLDNHKANILNTIKMINALSSTMNTSRPLPDCDNLLSYNNFHLIHVAVLSCLAGTSLWAVAAAASKASGRRMEMRTILLVAIFFSVVGDYEELKYTFPSTTTVAVLSCLAGTSLWAVAAAASKASGSRMEMRTSLLVAIFFSVVGDYEEWKLLPIIAEKVHQEKEQQEKLKAVKAPLNFEEASQYSESGTPSRMRSLKERLGSTHVCSMSGSPELRRGHSESPRKRGPEGKMVLEDKGKSTSAYSNDLRRRSYHSSRRNTERCYQSSRSRETEFAFEKHHNKRTSTRRTKALSEREGSAGGRWKSKPKRQKSSVEDDLSQQWAIYEEVEKLVDAGIIKEVDYHSWLSNPVMVKKHDGSWRMCLDFKDLYKACLKDGYPLLEIDWKIESRCGYPFKCFLDAYKGYHQIKMAKEDEEKTTFITSQGIFCYSKMPFKLKNAGATYQRLMDKAFQKQIDRNLKIYVDDLVIKSRTEQEIIRDMEETFKTLREINMELNLKKCTFGIRECMFLGYKVNADGLRVCPDKVEAVLKKEELAIYLAAAKEVISAVLMTKRDGKQMPIYLVIRAIQGPKINYTLMEKLILALRLEDDLPDTPLKDKEELPNPWILFTNGSSCIDGSGAVLIITNPKGMEFTCTLRFRFHATNNEAEYEALIAGLRITEQIGDTYTIKYLEKVKNLANTFKEFSIKQVPKGENKKADALSKMASTSYAYLSKQVLIEELKEKSIDEKEVLAIVEEKGHTWMTPIYEYLTKEILPEEKRKARAICHKAGSPPVPRNLQHKVTPITSPWPFYKWEIDIARPFPKGPGKVKFLIVAIDYFTKWIEAKPMEAITGAQIKKIIGMPTLRTAKVDMTKNDEALEINLDLLEEKKEQAAVQEAKSKAMMEKYYNARVRNTSFNPGDLIYRNNKSSHAKEGGKLGPKWEVPYEVTKALGKGAYKLRDCNGSILPRT
uniref:Probable inactive serine/threonine-protein kinase bub1 n=1 Tax=Tanacetum cinerariifolium TaxID=118510 RepID=A0A6L2J567_TANCI|nr:probable inactive serine/threonine-protein kinase bub1 [Tanacetum cinerariifolium]